MDNNIYLVLEFDNNLINIPFRSLEYVDSFTEMYDNPLELVASLNKLLALGIPNEEILDAYLATSIYNINDDKQEFTDRSLAVKYNRNRFNKDDLLLKLITYLKSNLSNLHTFSGMENILNNYRKKKKITGNITDKEIEAISNIYLNDSYKRRKECYFKLKDKGIKIKEDEHKIDYSKVSLKELDEEELYLLITLTNMSLDELKEYTHKQMASGHTR